MSPGVCLGPKLDACGRSHFGRLYIVLFCAFGTPVSSSYSQVKAEFVGLFTADRPVLDFPTLGWHLSRTVLHSEGLSLGLQDIQHPWSCPLDASSNLPDIVACEKSAPEGSRCHAWLVAIKPDQALVEDRDRGLVSMSLEAGTMPGME